MQARPVKFTAKSGALVPQLRKQAKQTYLTDSVLLNSDVYLNGVKLDCSLWEAKNINEGDKLEIVPNVYVTAIAGSIVAAIGLTGIAATVATAVFSAVIAVGLSFAVNFAMSLLFPQPKPQKIHYAEQKALPVVEGAQNSYRPFEPLPIVVGTTRIVPDHAVPYYSVVTNGAQEVRHLFCVSAGSVEVSDIRKDSTSINSLTGIEYYIYNDWRGEPLKWFNTAMTVTQENFATKDYVQFKADSPINTKGVGFVLSFPTGLRAQDLGNNFYNPVGVHVVTYCTSTTGQQIRNEQIILNNDGNLSTYRGMVYIDLPVGKWSIAVEVSGRLPDGTKIPCNNKVIEPNFWFLENNIVELQWHRDEPAVKYTGQSRTFIELKATASDKLTGGLNTVNCLATMKGKKEDGTLVTSSNIALQARRLLTDSDILLNTEYVTLDEDSFNRFEEHCDKYGFTVNFSETQGRTVGEVLSDMLAIGQAYITNASGKYEIFYDDPSQPYVDVINSRNSWGMTITNSRAIKPVDGLIINFTNKDKDYQPDDRLVHETGIDPVNVESIYRPMIDNAELAYKDGMLLLTMQKIRNSVYTFNTDWRSIDYKLGQKLLIQHPTFFEGIGTAGKVIDYIIDGSLFRGVVLDQFYNTDEGKNYALTLAQKDIVKFWDIQGEANENTNVLYFPVPLLNEADLPQLGDLFIFGEIGKAGKEVLIRNITRNKNFSAEVECLISSEDYYKAISGVIPEYESTLTFPTVWDRYKPYTPAIVGFSVIRETAAKDEFGNIKASVIMSLNYIEKDGVNFDSYIISIKELNSTAEPVIYISKEKENFVFADIYQNLTYEISVKVTTLMGIDSELASYMYTAAELMENLPDITGFTTVYNGSRLELVYNAVTDWRPFVYEIRSGSWESGQVVATHATAQTMPLLANGTYFIKAFSGLAQSANAASLEVEQVTGEGLPINVLAVIDEAETLFNGNLNSDFVYNEESNTIRLATGNNIRAVANIRSLTDFRNPNYTGAQGIYNISEEKTITIDNNHKCNITATVTAVATARNANFRAIEDIRTATDIRGVVSQGYSTALDISTRLSGVWGEFIPLYPSEYIGDGFKFRLRASASPDIILDIYDINISVDVPDKLLEFNQILIPESGKHIDFVPAFNAIPTVVGTILDNEGQSTIQVNKETITKTSAFVKIVDTAGQAQQHEINLIAKGY